MAKLDSLIRHKKWELDLKRRELARLEEEREQIIGQMNGLVEELERESGKSGSGISLVTMGAYAAGVKYRKEVLEEQLGLKEVEIEESRTILREAFQEMKTYEIAHEKRLAEEALAEGRQEQSALDEQGNQNYHRSKPEQAEQ